jgi:hypothetical protein
MDNYDPELRRQWNAKAKAKGRAAEMFSTTIG